MGLCVREGGPSYRWGCVLERLPENHHIDGVVCQGGDQPSQRDEEHDRKQEVRTLVGARTGAGSTPTTTLAVSYTDTVCVLLHQKKKNTEDTIVNI